MKLKHATYVKNILFPCLGLSLITGSFTGALIFLFKLACNAVISLSDRIYDAVRANPIYLPLLLLGALVIGLLASLILKLEPSGRGGGIPTAIAILRGLITFRWLRNLLAVFSSAILTYLCAIPLGTEGPSVQMGTAVGSGTVRLLAKNNRAWDRYIMTGGACTGFASATGAPLTGIFFAFEEAHRRFSPMIFMASATAVFSGYAVSTLLCKLANIHSKLFELQINTALPLKYIWTAVLVGVVAGVMGIVFSKLFRFIDAHIDRISEHVSIFVRIPVVFVATALIGFASKNLIGSGHALIESILEGHGVWYLLLLYLAVRTVLIIVANNTGVTGGLFIPSLAVGALVGALTAKVLIALELLPETHFVLIVAVGMASFLSSSSRTPITAIAFSIEALGCIFNLLPVIAGVTTAYLVIETARITSYTEVVVENKEDEENKGKIATVIDEHMTVAEGAFIVEKEIIDILWPPTCTVLSVTKNPLNGDLTKTCIRPGDVLHLHYRTCNAAETRACLEAIVGRQENRIDPDARIHVADENHQVPQL